MKRNNFHLLMIVIYLCFCSVLFGIAIDNFVHIATRPEIVQVPTPAPQPIIVNEEKLRPEDTTSGYYSFLGDGQGKIVCTDISTCFHESAHHLDHLLGMPSMSLEWELSVLAFINICEEYENFYCTIKDFSGVNGNPFQTAIIFGETREWGGYSELYAKIYDMSKTNMVEIPTILNIFYQEGWNE